MWILRANGTAGQQALTVRLMPGTARTLGRGPQANFVVDAALVSRLHCRFVVDGSGKLAVEDLGSTNGTWVNDQRVDRADLAAGDRVRAGQLELVVEASRRPEP